MKKYILVILFVVGILFLLRFTIGGPEDTWICVDGQWVKHGNPSAPMPESGCGDSSTTNSSDPTSESTQLCQSQSGSSMTYSDAKVIAQENCLDGKLKEDYFCNDYTGTWWIDFEPDEPKEGCNPACVVNVETKETEINWRCTGLIEQ